MLEQDFLQAATQDGYVPCVSVFSALVASFLSIYLFFLLRSVLSKNAYRHNGATTQQPYVPFSSPFRLSSMYSHLVCHITETSEVAVIRTSTHIFKITFQHVESSRRAPRTTIASRPPFSNQEVFSILSLLWKSSGRTAVHTILADTLSLSRFAVDDNLTPQQPA